MKKLAFFLALTLVITSVATVCAPVAMAAESRTQCVCCGKAVGLQGHTCTNLTYEPWTATDCLPQDTGNYYLTADVNCNKDATKLIPTAGSTINLDLNGHTAESPWRVFQMMNANVTLNISDSVGGGKLLTHRTGKGQGGVIWLSGKNITVNLYSGTLDATGYVGDSTATDDPAARGLAVCVEGENSVFNMYGGTVLGGKTTNLETTDKNGVGKGGAIYVAKNTAFNMYGGTVSGGQADAGGNVYSLGTANIQGGTLTGGKASISGKGFGGGNLCVYGGTATIGGDAEILNGTAGAAAGDSRYGGNIYVISGATLTLGDCLISGGVSTGDGGNIRNNGTVTVASGAKPMITKGSAQGSVTSATANYQNLGTGDLTGYVFAAWGTATQLPNTAGAYYLTTDVTQGDTTKLPITSGTVRLDLNGHTAASPWRVYQLNSGSNVTLDIYDTAGGGVMKTTRTSGAAQGAVIWLGGTDNTVNLYGGTLDGSAYTTSTLGGTVLCAEGTRPTFNQYGGTLIGGQTTAQGGTVQIGATSGVYNLYDGVVKNGTASRGGNIQVNGGSGAMGTFNMYGGLVTGGTATSDGGGNIDTTSLAVANLLGGTVENGTALRGGNIQLGGTTVMRDLTVTGGTATTVDPISQGGGNLYIKDNVTVTAANATFENGTAACCGGNICSYGTLTLSGCTLKDGKTLNTTNTGYGGGNLAVMNGSASVIDDTQLLNGSVGGTNRYGGNAYVFAGKTLNLGDCLLSGGVATGDGGNLRNDGTVTVLPGTEPKLTKGSAKGSTSGPTANYQNIGTAPDLALYCYYDWTSVKTLPTTTGNYTLQNDIALANPGDGGFVDKSNVTIKFDLNGHTVSCPGRFFYTNKAETENVSFTICDSVGTGKMIANQPDSTREGGIFWLCGRNNSLTITGGTFDASNYVGADVDLNTTHGKGTVIFAEGAGSTVNITGGTFIGGSTKNLGGVIAVTENTELNISGGTFIGGTTSNYGAILNTSGSTTVSGGSFVNGTVTGTGFGEGIVVRTGAFTLTGAPTFEGEGTDLGFTVNARHDTVDLTGYTGETLSVDTFNNGMIGYVDDETKFVSADETKTLTLKNDCLYIANAGGVTVKTASGEKNYASLQEALNDSDARYIQLNANYDDEVTVTGKDVKIDLNGYRLSGKVTLDDGKEFRGFDSTSDTYTAAQGRMFAQILGGKLAGTARNDATARRYAAVSKGNYYTFNRFYVGATHIYFMSNSMGAGYKATFCGNDDVKSVLANAGDQTLAFGLKFSVPTLSDTQLYAKLDAAQFITGAEHCTTTCYIEKIMKDTNTVEQNNIYANAAIEAKAYICLNGEMVESATYAFTLRNMVEQADSQYKSFSTESQTALRNMLKVWGEVMATWDLPNISAACAE